MLAAAILFLMSPLLAEPPGPSDLAARFAEIAQNSHGKVASVPCLAECGLPSPRLPVPREITGPLWRADDGN
jgi:hypothetical protein